MYKCVNGYKYNLLKHIYMISSKGVVIVEKKVSDKKESVKDVMKDLEETVNSKSAIECLVLLNTSVETNDMSILIDPMKQGAKEFEERVGRPMTYSEMREMWG